MPQAMGNHSAQGKAAVSLLQLPDPCLQEVLRCCADDPRSVCSAARAHSRLHRAATIALSSITLEIEDQEQLDNLVYVYLPAHGQHVDRICLEGNEWGHVPELDYLPATLTRLSSLQLERMHLLVQPDDSLPGVLGALTAAAPALKNLRLIDASLLDEGPQEALETVLALLPGLEHLSFSCSGNSDENELTVPGCLLVDMQQLTYLELAKVWLQGLDPIDNDFRQIVDLQHLSALTRLLDLRLEPVGKYRCTAGSLAGAQDLTRLQLSSGNMGSTMFLEPAVLSGKTRLQHLELDTVGQLQVQLDTWVEQLLGQLRQMQQLTCLKLQETLHGAIPCAQSAAYAALTASTKVQHLDISYCCLPSGVWQHIFPAGRQLPQLHTLNIAEVKEPASAPAAAPEGSRLVSCCPALQLLDLQGLQLSTELLAALQGLSGLTALTLQPPDGSTVGLEGVCQLTGLRKLEVVEAGAATDLLLQLTQLQLLTHLRHGYHPSEDQCTTHSYIKTRSSEPVWRQVLESCRDYGNPAQAAEAAAALAALQPDSAAQ